MITQAHATVAAVAGLLGLGSAGAGILYEEREHLQEQITETRILVAANTRAAAFQTYRELEALYKADGKLSPQDAIRLCLALDRIKNFRPAWTRQYCK